MNNRTLIVAIAVIALSCVQCAPTREPVAALCAARENRRMRESKMELQDLVQYQVYLYEHKNLTYTYTECSLMIKALEGFCKVNDHTSLSDVHELMYTCSAFVAPVAHNMSRLDEQCEIFYDLVSGLYCPLDPCVQITFEANNAHNAICNLLAVEKVDAPPAGIPVPQPTAHMPLTYAEYSQVVLSSCHQHSNSTLESLCASFSPRFEREGCEVFVTRLAEIVAPNSICNTYSCNDTSIPDMWTLLQANETDTVDVQAYTEFLIATNHSYVLESHAVGIRLVNATYGLGEKCAKFNNNMLRAMNASCHGKLECDVPAPNATAISPAPSGKDGCSFEFEVKYVCSDGVNATVHDVFGGEKVPYKTFKLSCMSDLPHYTINNASPALLPPPQGYAGLYDGPLDMRKHMPLPAPVYVPLVESRTLDAHAH